MHNQIRAGAEHLAALQYTYLDFVGHHQRLEAQLDACPFTALSFGKEGAAVGVKHGGDISLEIVAGSGANAFGSLCPAIGVGEKDRRRPAMPGIRVLLMRSCIA